MMPWIVKNPWPALPMAAGLSALTPQIILARETSGEYTFAV
jgi:hypothetical protein